MNKSKNLLLITCLFHSACVYECVRAWVCLCVLWYVSVHVLVVEYMRDGNQRLRNSTLNKTRCPRSISLRLILYVSHNTSTPLLCLGTTIPRPSRFRPRILSRSTVDLTDTTFLTRTNPSPVNNTTEVTRGYMGNFS